jgi:hypothetical protein
VARPLLEAERVGALYDDDIEVDARDPDPPDPLARVDLALEQVGEQ